MRPKEQDTKRKKGKEKKKKRKKEKEKKSKNREKNNNKLIVLHNPFVKIKICFLEIKSHVEALIFC